MEQRSDSLDGFGRGIYAVSYTHLDVYKRQALGGLGIRHFGKDFRGDGLVTGLLQLVPECCVSVLGILPDLLLQFFRKVDLPHVFYRSLLTHSDTFCQKYVILAALLCLGLPLHLSLIHI